MTQFESILLVSPLADGNTWVLMRPFDLDLTEEAKKLRVQAPGGFQTDFASIPRPFWAVLPKWGKYGNAAVIHDWMYWDQTHTRRVADGALLAGMVALKVPRWQQVCIYRAVRLFGWLAWKRNAADRVAGFNRVLSELPTSAAQRSLRRGQYARLALHMLGKR